MKLKLIFFILCFSSGFYFYKSKTQTKHEKAEEIASSLQGDNFQSVLTSENFYTSLTYQKDKEDSFIEFFKLQEIELKTAEQKEQYESYLENSMLLKSAKDNLLSFGQHFDKIEEKQRLQFVKYLADAIAFNDHSQIEEVKKIFLDLIEDESYFAIKDQKQKKSIIGDRLELFIALLEADELLAYDAFNRHKDRPLEHLFRLGLQMVSV